MVAETYEGWANFQTWNVALWIQNDFGLYSLAASSSDYWDLLSTLVCCGERLSTPDGVYFDDPRLDFAELDEVISELSE